MMPGSNLARTLMIIVAVFVIIGLVLAMAGTPYTP
jgi:preprotein translocase subunit SecG